MSLVSSSTLKCPNELGLQTKRVNSCGARLLEIVGTVLFIEAWDYPLGITQVSSYYPESGVLLEIGPLTQRQSASFTGKRLQVQFLHGPRSRQMSTYAQYQVLELAYRVPKGIRLRTHLLVLDLGGSSPPLGNSKPESGLPTQDLQQWTTKRRVPNQ